MTFCEIFGLYRESNPLHTLLNSIYIANQCNKTTFCRVLIADNLYECLCDRGINLKEFVDIAFSFAQSNDYLQFTETLDYSIIRTFTDQGYYNAVMGYLIKSM